MGELNNMSENASSIVTVAAAQWWHRRNPENACVIWQGILPSSENQSSESVLMDNYVKIPLINQVILGKLLLLCGPQFLNM